MQHSTIIDQGTLVARRAEQSMQWLHSPSGASITRFVFDWELAQELVVLAQDLDSESAHLLLASYYESDTIHIPVVDELEEDCSLPDLYTQYKENILKRYAEVNAASTSGKKLCFEQNLKFYRLVSGKVGRFLLWAAKDADMAPAVKQINDRYFAIHGESITAGLYEMTREVQAPALRLVVSNTSSPISHKHNASLSV